MGSYARRRFCLAAERAHFVHRGRARQRPRNKLWDANLENWPRVLARALAFQPLSVLPGHGDAGGPEILTGQQAFLQDLFSAVKKQVDAAKTLAQIDPALPDRDRNWIPRDLSTDVAIAYSEITRHKPAGDL